jgi:hypothetical protein
VCCALHHFSSYWEPMWDTIASILWLKLCHLWGNWNNCCGYVFTKRKSWSPLLHWDQYLFLLLVKYFIILYSLVFSSLWVYYVIYLLASINPIDKVVISHSWPLCKWLWICRLRCGPRAWRSFSKYHTWDWCSASIDSQEGKLGGKNQSDSRCWIFRELNLACINSKH